MIIFDLKEFLDKDIVFIGRGREGLSFEKFIKANVGIKSFRFTDQQDGPNYLDALKQLDPETTVVVKTPGCPGRLVPVKYTTPTRVFFLCARQLGSKIIGVTGTKGKSTTASLIGAMLVNGGVKAVVAGNIGLPMLDALENADASTVFVLELSSYQLSELETSPDIAAITNLYRDHIDYHENIENYWEAKRNIMRYMTEDKSLVYNPDFDIIQHWLAETKCKSVAINTQDQIDMSKCQLIGDHNKLNAIMARNVAELMGVDRTSIQAALNNFKPIPHRLQKVRTVKGITFVDDAIGSQPEATIAGITACVRQIGPVGCVMLGGQDRDYDFEPLVKMLSQLMIPKLVLFPDTGAKIKALFPDNYQPECFETRDMYEAVKWASEHCPSGSVCLLSTASPSYSIWKDFEQKGEQFQEAVMGIAS